MLFTVALQGWSGMCYIERVSTEQLGTLRTNAAWVQDLSGQGETQAAALADLRALLRRAALHALSRTGLHGARLARDQTEAVAEA
jgi:hypothetical protein